MNRNFLINIIKEEIKSVLAELSIRQIKDKIILILKSDSALPYKKDDFVYENIPLEIFSNSGINILHLYQYTKSSDLLTYDLGITINPGNKSINAFLSKGNKLAEYSNSVFAQFGQNVMGSIGDASFIGHDGLMKGNSKKPIYKTPKSSIHYKKGKFPGHADFYNDDNWETEKNQSYTMDDAVPKSSIHHKKYKEEQLSIPSTPDGMIDGGVRKLKNKDEDDSEIQNENFYTPVAEIDDTVLGKIRKILKLLGIKIDNEFEKNDEYYFDVSSERYEGRDPKLRHHIEKIADKLGLNVGFDLNRTNLFYFYKGENENVDTNFNEIKDYDDNVVPKNSIHFGERDKVDGESKMKFKEIAQDNKFKSDAEIEQSYSNFDIEEFKFNNDRQKSGFISIDFKNRESVVDDFIIYDDGKIAFENWYPDVTYFKLCKAIYDNITIPELKDKVKKILSNKGHNIKEILLSKKIKEMKSLKTEGDWKSNLSKAVMDLTPEANPSEPSVPVPQRTFGETPEFPYTEDDGTVIVPIPGLGIAIKKGDEWTFGDTPKMTDVIPSNEFNVSDSEVSSCNSSHEEFPNNIDIPCDKKPIIKKFLMKIKKEQSNLHEGIYLNGIYNGKKVKLNTIYSGDERMFKSYIKEGTSVYKINFGPKKGEVCK